MKEKRAIVLFNWTPNWVEAVYDGKFIEFPEYAPECETDPSWGINPDLSYDCGNPKDGWLKKAVWADTEKNWPCAFRVLQNIDLNNLMFAKLAVFIDVNNMSYEDASTKWISNNEKLWRSWIPKCCLD